jgi:N-acetylmuramoyl-L-alanine amidase
LHKTDDNLNVAKRENAVILQEDNYERKYDGFDPNSPEANIIFSLYQNAFLDQSLYFADRLQHEFKTYANRHNRGVKQAGFLVLYKTTMPSVLIETGFLTNGEDEKFLKSELGQQKMANAILKAFNTYKHWVDGTSIKQIPIEEITEVDKPKTIVEQPQETNFENTIAIKEKAKPGEDEIVYRVQVYNSPERVSLKSSRFRGRTDVWEYYVNNSWKYTVGNCEKQEEALLVLERAIQANVQPVQMINNFLEHFLQMYLALEMVINYRLLIMGFHLKWMIIIKLYFDR